jgi:hypothetical protein
MKRNSKIFGTIDCSGEASTLKVKTKFPEKWILIDTEYLKLYQGSKNNEITKNWIKISEPEKQNDLINLLKNINLAG